MLWIHDFFGLIYPRICACCGNSLWKHEEIVCTLCHYHLPRTTFHLEEENPVTRLFWGREKVASAASCFWFNKGGKVQRLIHQLKYKGRKDIGIWLGKEYGRVLRTSPLFSEAEIIIPVPLHRKRLMKRGYNQAEQFAIGLGASMGIPVAGRILTREKATSTQTRKSRFSRWENVHGIFSLSDPQVLANRHVLVVDDVVTTGATLEAILHALHTVPGIRVSLATIAYTRV